MDIPNLDTVVRDLFSAGLAPASQRNYRTGTKRYLEFCQGMHNLTPFPVTELVLSQFVAWLHIKKLSCSTVKNYLAAVRHSQIALGLGDPRMGNMPQLEYVIRGMKRKSQATGRQRLPITPEIMRGMKQVWQRHPNPKDAAMLWAASTMCFFGFLRSGEVVVPGGSRFDPTVHLAHGDVSVSSYQDPQFLQVRIKASKTDPYRQGATIYLGRAPGELCPVAAVLGYMVSRGTEPGPFFRFTDGRFLTRDRFVEAIRRALTTMGHNCAHYAGHSFRIGAAMTAARQGLQDSLIKTLGRWESTAYTLYIRTPREVLCSVAGTLTGPAPPRAAGSRSSVTP